MLHDQYPLYLSNEPQQPNADLPVIDKYTQDEATRVAKADPEILDRAIAAAHEAAVPMRKMKGYQRQAVLNELVDRCEDRSEELAMGLCIEAG
jgi:acyl-CoA reductase-like NAD-dependent aldehyde dehydrogenase